MKLHFCFWLIVVFSACTINGQEESGNFFSDDMYANYTWKSFAKLPEANRIIDLKNPDYSLLNAAVFFASNKARQQNGKSSLRFTAPLRNMASHHAGAMAKYDFVDHYNKYDRKFYSPEKRGKYYQANVGAENVASEFLHKYNSGTRYYAYPGDSYYEYFTATGEKIEQHTYVTFAAMIVDGWMGSRSHRKNLLLTDLKSMGCGVKIGEKSLRSQDMPMAYGVQNFSFQ